MQLFVNDLTVMDFSYLCPKRGMVGESWIVDVILDGDLNEESMVQDFGKVKKNLKKLIDEYVDHKLLVPAEHASSVVRHEENSEQVEVQFSCDQHDKISLYCPADAYAFIYADAISMDSVRDYLREVIAIHLPDNVANITLNLRTEVIDSPYYHYTHGLKKHDGNCQRIAHGHRSRIDVFHDEKVSLDSQQYWADRFADIYIVTQEDCVDYQHRQMRAEVEQPADYYCLAYEATQGYFEMLIAKHRCEMVQTDTTVECLAQYIFDQEKERVPNTRCKVMAYEGVGKGAIVGE